MNYICLGEDCLPRSLLTFANIKQTKKNGELTLPFDLMISDIKSIESIVKSNFVDFFTNLKSEPINYFVNDGNFIQNDYTNLIFNHESESTCRGYSLEEDFYTKDNFQEFKIRYKSRIENIKTVLNNEKSNCFVIHLVHISSYDYINTFVQFLYNFFGNDIKIIVIFSEKTKSIEKLSDDRITYFSYSFDGLWNNPPENLDTLVKNFLNMYNK